MTGTCVVQKRIWLALFCTLLTCDVRAAAEEEVQVADETQLTERQRFCKFEASPDLQEYLFEEYEFGKCETEPKLVRVFEAALAKAADSGYFEEKNSSVILLHACNRTYLHLDAEVAYLEGAETCCRYGLQPLYFDNRAQLDCLVNALIEREAYLVAWTGGMWLDCRFQWLLGRASVASDLWAAHQPNKEGDHRCITVSVNEAQPPHASGLQDTNCDDNVPLMCFRNQH